MLEILFLRTLSMQRRNDVVKLAARKLSEKLDIDLLEAAEQVAF